MASNIDQMIAGSRPPQLVTAFQQGYGFGQTTQENQQLINMRDLQNKREAINLRELQRTTTPEYIAQESAKKAEVRESKLDYERAQTERLQQEVSKLKSDEDVESAKIRTDSLYRITRGALDPSIAAQGEPPIKASKRFLMQNRDAYAEAGGDPAEIDKLVSIEDPRQYHSALSGALIVLPKMRALLDERGETGIKVSGKPLVVMDKETGTATGDSAFMATTGDVWVHDPTSESGKRRLKEGESILGVETTAGTKDVVKPIAKMRAKVTEYSLKKIDDDYRNAVSFEPTVEQFAQIVLSDDFESGKFQALVSKPIQEWASSTLGYNMTGTARDLSIVDGLSNKLVLMNTHYQKGNLNQNEWSAMEKIQGKIDDPKERLKLTALSLREAIFREKEMKFASDRWIRDPKNKGDLSGFAESWEKKVKENPRMRLQITRDKNGNIVNESIRFFTSEKKRAAEMYGEDSKEYNKVMKNWKDDSLWQSR